LPPDLSARLGGPAGWASLRPEAIRLTDAAPRAKGRVTGLRYLGLGTRVAVDVDGTELVALVPAGAPLPAEGASVGLTWAEDAAHRMDGEA
jgi:putative spermidine/putrescine transport system ATP-binding protein